MTAVPKLDVRDLGSVRRVAADYARRAADRDAEGQVVLGDDWVMPDTSAEGIEEGRRRRSTVTLNRSPLARKIITFNLVALIALVSGMLYMAPARDNLAYQRASGLVSEAMLIADVVEAQLPAGAPVSLATGDGIDIVAALAALDLRGGVEVFVHDTAGTLIARRSAPTDMAPVPGLERDGGGTVITDALNSMWDGLARLLSPQPVEPFDVATDGYASELAARALAVGTAVDTFASETGGSVFAVATPIRQGDRAIGTISLTSAAGEINALVRQEREQILQLFVVGILVSIGLSLVLASTIANPLAELAAAAEAGRERNARKMAPGRVRIPDLTARPDEIGRLSGALRGMVAALYDRIEANEQTARMPADS